MVLKDTREPLAPAAEAQLSGLKVPPQVHHIFTITDGARCSEQTRLGTIFSRKQPNNLSHTAVAPNFLHFLHCPAAAASSCTTTLSLRPQLTSAAQTLEKSSHF